MIYYNITGSSQRCKDFPLIKRRKGDFLIDYSDVTSLRKPQFFILLYDESRTK